VAPLDRVEPATPQQRVRKVLMFLTVRRAPFHSAPAAARREASANRSPARVACLGGEQACSSCSGRSNDSVAVVL